MAASSDALQTALINDGGLPARRGRRGRGSEPRGADGFPLRPRSQHGAHGHVEGRSAGPVPGQEAGSGVRVGEPHEVGQEAG